MQGIVEKLVAAEGSPVTARLDRNEAKAQAGLSAMGAFKSALAELQTSLKGLQEPQNFQTMSAGSDDEDVLTVTANDKAQAGEYEIEVNQLAESQRLTSVLFDSLQEPLGGGVLKFQFGTYDEDENIFKPNPGAAPKTIEITEDRSTLRNIQQTINKADFGVRASIINDGDGFRLVLSSEKTGAENSLRISVEDNDVMNNDLAGLSLISYTPEADDGEGRNMVEMQAAMDAEVEIDGIPVSSPTNTINKALEGITLDLKDTGDADIRIFVNKGAVLDKIWKFVEQYNKFVDVIDSLTGYDPETRQAGPLNGDATIRGVTNQIRRIIGTAFSNINEDYVSLAGIGLKTDYDGKLTLDHDTLNEAVEENIGEVINLFATAGSVTDPQLQFLEAGDRTIMGAWDVNISQKPTLGGYAGLEVDEIPVTINEVNDEFSLNVDGIELAPIKLTHRTYYAGHELAKELETQINIDGKLKANGGKVKVTYYDDRLIIISERFGSGSKVEITASDFGAVRDLGLAKGGGLAGKDVEGMIGNFKTFGIGKVLAGRQDIEGLKIEVSGGVEGDAGKVIFSRGVASQLNNLLQQILDSQGPLKPRLDGFNNRIDDINDQRDRLTRKLEKTEERYLKQFTELDALIGKMSSTGNFLTNQLSALPGAGRSGKK
ncbi:MAG: flagellar filament capping protein FliD [Gammaproteobacteria bacterium]|nr:flagellar filament capping protein FliD [Gammaproteobacteria bacterium]